MKSYTLIILIALSITCSAQSGPEQTIRKILDEQTTYWNEGNIDAFMKGYWKSDSLLFVGKNGPTYGYQNTLNNYKKSYPDTANMGKLAFNILSVKPISKDTWFVLGKWMLTRSVGNVSGHYTLLFKKIKGEWVIVMDHSS